MKKRIVPVLMAAVLVTSVATGCSNKKVEETTAPTTVAPTEPTTEAKPDVAEKEVGIVVIGATTAGLSAAVQAVEEGADAQSILILEKGTEIDESIVSNLSAVNAADSAYQINAKVEDSVEAYEEDIKKVGTDKVDAELVTYLAENASGALDWLVELGGNFGSITQDNGSSILRSHRPSDGSTAGKAVITLLTGKAEELKIPVSYETTVTEILMDDDGVVSGVKATTKDGEVVINCKSVIIADGGFGGNAEMVKANSEAMAVFASISPKTNDGAGINLAKKAGAALINMDQIAMYPLVDTQKNMMVTGDLYRSGAILVNKDGQRFVSETETESRLAAAISQQKDATAYIVFDDAVKANLKIVDEYVAAGIVKEAANVAELAKAIGVDETNLSTEAKEATGVSSGKIYAIECKPAIYYTLGGIRVNTCAEVLTEDEGIIPGLFAAGEAVGGVHGSALLDGNILTENLVFGRTAGVEANSYYQDNK